MTTKASGGKITGLLALTLEAQSALAVGDPVHIVGDYMCDKADGSLPVVGFVSVRNVGRGTVLPPNANPNAGFYPVANVPGDVTVEALGLSVRTLTASGAVTIGHRVAIGAAGTVVDGGASGAAPGGTAIVGIALEAASGAGVTFDVLVGHNA